jgi:hypothetical protein
MTTNLYQPLDPDTRQIRLLTLHPSHDTTTPIQGTIDVVDLDDQPEYEAFSWVWGSLLVRGSIILNGETKTIRLNKEDALRQFRLRNRTRRLWTDEICID